MQEINFTNSNQLKLKENGVEFEAPQWVDFLISLGGLCRIKQDESSKKIVTLAVLPSREFAAGFTALGSLLHGAKMFEDNLSWLTFKSLPINSEVHFKPENATSKYSGNIIDYTKIEGIEFIVVKVTKPARVAKGGGTYLISKNKFDNYFFSVEKPPTISRNNAMEKANRFYEDWLENLNPKWIWSDGAESLIVGALSDLTTGYKNLFFSSRLLDQISMDEMLCMQHIKEPHHSKLRITHPRGDLEGNFPLIILDGPDAFNIFTHRSMQSNILILLERSEYHENIHNTVLQLKQTATDITEQMLYDLPSMVPAGIEFISFAVN